MQVLQEVLISNDEQFHINRTLKTRKCGGKMQYLVI